MTTVAQARQIDRWAEEDAAAAGRPEGWDAAWRAHCATLEVEATGPCHLCDAPRRQWADLCDDCADAVQDLADALDPAQPDVYFHTIDVEAIVEAIRVGNVAGVNTMDLGTVYKSNKLTSAEAAWVRLELGRRS